ncbi:MAG TPA: urea ABC transporter ATP-binding subunit UrtE [Planctomycetes bacterium]|nr:urea ABC transporter ATP-binding subunit UrtE [Planctomycetota bacterium]|tara:strand:- start:25 stop:753 length:729 start_codon:yes stop_codon:yes gene_type:complete
MLKIKNLSFAYGSIQTLNSVDMEMETGKVTCILGRNGVGKTTLLKNIMGILKPSSESVIQIDDVELTTASRFTGRLSPMAPHLRAKLGLGYVPQGRQIFPRITVEENLKVALQARRDRSRVIPGFVYDLFPVLKEMGGRMGGDLSGGQQQQLAIARALCGDPEILVLDEPTEGIQPNIIQQIGEILRQLVEERGMTVVLVEQYLDFVKEFGHNFYVLNRGRVVAEGETSELSDDIISKHLSV